MVYGTKVENHVYLKENIFAGTERNNEQQIEIYLENLEV